MPVTIWTDRIFYYLAIVANIIALISVVFMMQNAYGREVFTLFLLALPPVLSLLALLRGSDLEERRLMRDVRKARLRAELKQLGGG